MSDENAPQARRRWLAPLLALVVLASAIGAATVIWCRRSGACRVHRHPAAVAAPAEPVFRTKVARGAYVFQQRGCVACHGHGGRGGVANANYVLGTVPALNEIADKMGLYERDDADAFVRLIETGADLDAAASDASIDEYARVLAQYHAIRTVIENGATAGKLDANGPQPPLSMPAWKHVIPPGDIDCVIAYLVSLMPWDAPN